MTGVAGGVPPLPDPPPGYVHVAVWAPGARELVVDLDGDRQALFRHPEDPAWWVVDPPLADGAAYRVVVDGAALPDPRSAWQPEGVDGPSVAVDHRRYPWSDAGWAAPPLQDAVISEIHVGTFTPEGTYDAARRHLPDLVGLGITHVELLPLATYDGHHGWGYDGVDLYAPHPAYGTPDELKAFVEDCHGHGLAVLVDVVYNHLGPTGNHLARFGPYFTDRYATPWGAAVNLDGPGSPAVRRFIVDNAAMWLRDYHVDGLRLDAVHELIDTSARHLLEELADEVRALADGLGRPLVLVAENDTNDPRLVRPPGEGGYGLDAHWCDDVHHAIHTVITGEADGYYGDYAAVEGIAVLERALSRGYVYDGRLSPVRERIVGRPAAGLEGRRLVACIQNHDQIGNRARGERLAHLTSFAAQRIAAALLLTGPFVPLLFQGEEWAATSPFPYFADHGDPELADAVRRGRAEEFAAFGWSPDDVLDPESPATFELAKLRWDERREGEHEAMWTWYRDLLALRRSIPDLRDDRLGGEVRTDAAARTVLVRRGCITVLANLGDADAELPGAADGVLLASAPVEAGSDADHLVLPPCSVALVRATAERSAGSPGVSRVLRRAPAGTDRSGGTMPDALEATAAREAEAMFHAEGDAPAWGPGLTDLVAVLEEEGIDHLFIGGLASMVHGRPRVTRDVDVMVRPTDARRLLEGLAARGYETDERAPHWLFKAQGNGAEIDVIFQAVGEMYLDDAMLARGVWTDVQGTRIRVAGADDTFVMKALAHRELSPRHWFDALAMIANGALDWDVVVELASTRPRRVLSLLLYAQSDDLYVPSWVVDRLYGAARGDEDPARAPDHPAPHPHRDAGA